MSNVDRYAISSMMSKTFEWNKWREEIPYIDFPDRFLIKIMPPFSGAVIRFSVRDKKYKDAFVSVYLDCYDMLGYYGSPYWEVYPYDDDVYRCDMHSTDELIEIITKSIDEQISDNIAESVKNVSFE